MPPSPTLIARDRRILAGCAAGATLLDLSIAEELDPATVRRVLCNAGCTPGRCVCRPPSQTPRAWANCRCTR